MTKRNHHHHHHHPELNVEETVDQLEAEALDAEAPEAKRLGQAQERDERAEPAFDQDMEVEDLPGGAGEGGGFTFEPPG